MYPVSMIPLVQCRSFFFSIFIFHLFLMNFHTSPNLHIINLVGIFFSFENSFYVAFSMLLNSFFLTNKWAKITV